MGRTLSAVLFVIYIIIGVVVASGHHYFEHLDAVKPIVSAPFMRSAKRRIAGGGAYRSAPIVSAVLAVLLWPLVLLGVNLHLK